MIVRAITSLMILDSSLLEAYEAECAVAFLGKTNPSREMYAAMEQSGILRCFGLFDGTIFAGFATVLVTVYPHYSKKVATVESLFVQGADGTELMQAIEQYAKDVGCSEMMCSAPVGGRFERWLEAKKSYHRTSAVFGKRLD